MKTCYWVQMLMAHQMEAIVSDVLSPRMDSKRGHCPRTCTGKTAAKYTALCGLYYDLMDPCTSCMLELEQQQ